MTQRILALVLSLSVIICLFAGCRRTVTSTGTPADGETTGTDGNSTTPVEDTTTTAEYTIETDAAGNTVVVDSEGRVIADAGNGDTIETSPDGSIVVVDSSGETHTLTTTTTAATNAPVSGETPTTPTTVPTAPPATPLAYSGIVPGSAEAGSTFSTLARAPADQPVTVNADTKQFGRFLLTTADNAALTFNIACCLGDSRITAVVPADTDLSAIKANFTYYGKNVLYNGTELTSRSTAMNLTGDVTLTLCANDGSQKTMTVHIEKLATGLPSMSLTTSGYTTISNTTDYKTASFSVGGGNSSVCSYATADQTKGADCSVKGRGNTSWTYDKQSYTLRFDTKYPLLGLPESKNYVLLALYADQSLMRYRLGEYLSEAMGMEFTMNLRYVDLWLNGQYVGVYGLVEKIEVEKNHVDITDYVSTATPVNQIGYLLEFDDHLYTEASDAQRAAWTPVGKGYYDSVINETFFCSNVLNADFDWLMIRTTNAKNLTSDHVNYIFAVVNNAMEALKSGDYARISACIDVESFAKWYLIEEYLNNTDSDMTSSVYMYIDVGGKLKLGPLWDLDNCAGNHSSTTSVTDHVLYDSESGWFSYLFRCAEARDVLKAQWAAMQPVLSNVNSTLDSTAAMLNSAAALNFNRWRLLGYRLASQPAVIAQQNTYDKQVAYLKQFLASRQSALNSFYSGI